MQTRKATRTDVALGSRDPLQSRTMRLDDFGEQDYNEIFKVANFGVAGLTVRERLSSIAHQD